MADFQRNFRRNTLLSTSRYPGEVEILSFTISHSRSNCKGNFKINPRWIVEEISTGTLEYQNNQRIKSQRILGEIPFQEHFRKALEKNFLKILKQTAGKILREAGEVKCEKNSQKDPARDSRRNPKTTFVRNLAEPFLGKFWEKFLKIL